MSEDRTCAQQGHIWIETATGIRFVRHNQRPKGTVATHCAYCDALAEQERFAKHTAPPAHIPSAPAKKT